MTSVPIPATGSPKKRLIDMALGKCGIIGYDAEQGAFALNELDAMMLTPPFDALGYNVPVYETGSLEDLTGIDPKWDLAVSLSLAEVISPLMMNGKPLSPSAMAQKTRQMSLLFAYVATLPTSLIVAYPAGEGNRRLGRFATFIREVTASPGGTTETDELF